MRPLTAAEVDLLHSSDLEVSAGLELLRPDLTVREDISDDLVGGKVSRALLNTIHGTTTLSISRELTWGVDLVRPGGTVAVVGLMPEGRPVPVDMLELVTYEKRVVGSAYGTVSPRVLVPRIAELYLAGRLQLDELISERLPLEAIDDGFEHVLGIVRRTSAEIVRQLAQSGSVI